VFSIVRTVTCVNIDSYKRSAAITVNIVNVKYCKKLELSLCVKQL